MKGILKIAAGVAIAVIALVVVAVLLLPLWVGPVTTTAVDKVAPNITKSHVHLGKFALNYYTGVLEIGDFQLENPAGGYSQREALTIGNLRVEFDTTSLMSDVIHIRLISIKDLFASYVTANGTNNVDHLMYNAGLKQPEGSAAEPVKDEPEEPVKPSKPIKVIIDRIEFGGALVQVGPLPLPIPAITLNDIGSESGGLGIKDAWDEIIAKVTASAKDLGSALGVFGKSGLELLNGAASDAGALTGEASKKTMETLGEGAKQAEKHTKKVLNDIKSLFK